MWDDEFWETEPVRVRDVLRERLDPRAMPWRHRLGIVGLVGLFTLPSVLYVVQVSPLIYLLYLMIFAVSWDIVSGYTGQLSLGHAFFFALGGYTTSILNIQHGVDPFVSIPAGVLVAGIGGVLIGLPAIRLQGPYLSLVTLIVPVILVQFVILWNDALVLSVGPYDIPIAPNGLGGLSGLSRAPDPLISTELAAVVTVDSFQVSILANYYLALAALTVILLFLKALTASTTGDVFTAIREDEAAVRASGLNPVRFKLFAFVLSGLIGGLGGALFVHSPAGFPQTDAILNVQLSLDVIIVSILGGTGTLVGPVVGVLFFAGIDQLVEGYRPLPVLLVTILVIFFMPGGIVRKAIAVGRSIEARVTGRETQPVADGGRTPLESILASYSEEFRDMFR